MRVMTQAARRFRFIVRSHAGPDRNGLITDMDGWDLSNYRKNPVVLLNHQANLPPVGRAASVDIDGETMWAELEFGPHALGREIESLVDTGFLLATSIGARGLEYELRRDKDGWPMGVHSHRQELVEISVVDLPGDPNALRAMLGGDGQGLRLETGPMSESGWVPGPALGQVAAHLRDFNSYLRGGQ